jgi:hypothetical protein
MSAIKSAEDRDRTQRHIGTQRKVVLQRVAKLTRREKEVLSLMVTGQINEAHPTTDWRYSSPGSIAGCQSAPRDGPDDASTSSASNTENLRDATELQCRAERSLALRGLSETDGRPNPERSCRQPKMAPDPGCPVAARRSVVATQKSRPPAPRVAGTNRIWSQKLSCRDPASRGGSSDSATVANPDGINDRDKPHHNNHKEFVITTA